MTLCTWCGQQSQSDIICDWCKRPLPTRTATGGRPEIEFLRDGEEDKPNYLAFGIVAACVAVVGILLFFMLRWAGTSVSSSGGAASPRPSAPATNTPPQQVTQPVSLNSGRGAPGGTATGSALPPRTPGGTPLWPHEQSFDCLDVRSQYAAEIAPARTFAHSADIPQIQAAGLARGLDEESALILEESGYRNEPRFPEEPARHKLLDLIGDLYLSGVPLQFLNVAAQRSGHRMNVMAAMQLKAILEATPG